MAAEEEDQGPAGAWGVDVRTQINDPGVIAPVLTLILDQYRRKGSPPAYVEAKPYGDGMSLTIVPASEVPTGPASA